MTDMMQISNEIFGESCLITCKEVLYSFQIKYKITALVLPAAEKLAELCDRCFRYDDIEIRFDSVEKFSFSNKDSSIQSAYDRYRCSLEPDDTVEAVIDIKKKFKDNAISVYSIEKFTEFLCGLKIEESLHLFADLFEKEKQHIYFRILNCDSCIHTNSIAFGGEAWNWDGTTDRDNYIRNCNYSSVLFGREQYPIVPQDFTVIEQMYDSRLDRIKGLFDKLRSVLSYMYIANTSNIVGNQAILQFGLDMNGNKYELDQLSGNLYVCKLYDWIYKEEGCINRASIARNIINVYCRTKEDILNIGENVYNSSIANYTIYQKKHTEQYIELKNKLSGFIVESAGQLQELAHDLVEGFRNNFVAVIVFLMTVLLTDSIDFSNFTQTKVSANIVAVCGIFTFTSILYMIVTIITGNTKWRWIEKSYCDLKENYSGVLDRRDIETAVKNDAAFKNTEKEYKKVRFLISGVWALAIIGMLVFTSIIWFNGRRNEILSTGAYQSEGQIDSLEEKISETRVDVEME